jgi:hypothetical protein
LLLKAIVKLRDEYAALQGLFENQKEPFQLPPLVIAQAVNHFRPFLPLAAELGSPEVLAKKATLEIAPHTR